MIKWYNNGESVTLSLGDRKGISFTFRWKSAEDGITPYRAFSVFVYGTFLGLNPYTDRRCASNGVQLLYKTW